MDWSDADAMHQDRHEGSDYRWVEVITGRRWERLQLDDGGEGADGCGKARRWGAAGVSIAAFFRSGADRRGW